ncbi:MAG TPA: hypothetical protein PKC28_03815 [Bdellovibrionales bacterium]|nr:hypothetical protein [Bdellovibrionales bacterium]
MKALLLLTVIWTAGAWAGEFNIDDPKILGRYVLAQQNRGADIQDVAIIYNIQGELVLVRDTDQEYPLKKADAKGVIHRSEDEPNCGSGDEADCYYDASFTVTLGKTQSPQGQTIPQITIVVDRVDAYEANPDYTYTLVFNWSAELENAVPFYTQAAMPVELQDAVTACHKSFAKVFGGTYMSNRVCNDPDSYKIREDIDPKKAFAALCNDWSGTEPLKMDDLKEKLFKPTNKAIATFAGRKKLASKTPILIAGAHGVRDYISTKATAIQWKEGRMAFVFVLDEKIGMMHRFVFFRE